MKRRRYIPILPFLLIGAVFSRTPMAQADNKRLNNGVVANVYTIQRLCRGTGSR